jgi:hypothetical protein
MKVYAKIMKLNHQPSFEDYFKQNEPIFGNSYLKKIITLKKFQQINSNLHYSVHWLLKELNGKLKVGINSVSSPRKILHPLPPQPKDYAVFDETIFNCQGRCPFTTYIKTKPIPNGLLCYELVDNTGSILYFDFPMEIQLPPVYCMIDAVESCVHPKTSM